MTASMSSPGRLPMPVVIRDLAGISRLLLVDYGPAFELLLDHRQSSAPCGLDALIRGSLWCLLPRFDDRAMPV
jgi:hypothetical protein